RATFDLVEPIARLAIQTHAERMDREIAATRGIRAKRASVVVAEVVKVDLGALHATINAISAVEALLVIDSVEFVREHGNVVRPESVDGPIPFFGEHFHAFEGAAGIGPVEWRDESLRTVEQLLPPNANGGPFG